MADSPLAEPKVPDAASPVTTFTVDTLSRSAKEALTQQGLPVESISIVSDKLSGGYICATVRLAATYSSAGDKFPPTFIVKMEEPACGDHGIATDLHLYDREWLFYDKVGPFVTEAGVRIPKYWGALKAPDGTTAGVILEDLQLLDHPTQEARIVKSTLCPTMNSDAVALTVRALGRMHAFFYGKTTVLRDAGVQRHDGSWFNPAWTDKVRGSMAAFTEKWAPVYGDEGMATFRAIGDAYPAVQRHVASEPATFLHGDVKPGNMFMLEVRDVSSPDDHATRLDPAFIDWQYIAVGKGVCDLVFFLIEGFEPPQAAEFEALAAGVYLDALKEGGFDYPNGAEGLKKDWAVAVAYFPVYVCMWFGTVSDEALVDKTFPRRVVGRTLAAIQRHGTQAVVAGLA